MLVVQRSRGGSSDEAQSGEGDALLLGRSRSGQRSKTARCSQEGESWPKEPRFAFKLRRATFTIQAVRSCPGVHE